MCLVTAAYVYDQGRTNTITWFSLYIFLWYIALWILDTLIRFIWTVSQPPLQTSLLQQQQQQQRRLRLARTLQGQVTAGGGKPGLTPMFIKPAREVKDEGKKIKECIICYSDFPNHKLYKLLPCGHDQICFSCAFRITIEQGTCPLCRAEIITMQ